MTTQSESHINKGGCCHSKQVNGNDSDKNGTSKPKRLARANNAHHMGAALASLALVLIAAQLVRTADAQESSAPNSLNSQFVNLNEIQKHQQALVEECRQLEAQKLAELKQLVEFDHDNEQVHLGNTVTLKLPAVCLLLNGPPGAGGPAGAMEAEPPMRLDLVNWLYDAEDLLPASELSSNKTKRQTDLAKPGELLASQWLDLGRTQAEPGQAGENEIDLDGPQLEEKKFKEHLDRMLKDKAFQEAVQVDRTRIEPYLSPVVLVPGLAGSRLQARVSKTTRVNIICKREHDWQEMWLTLRSFLPLAIDCWLDNARLELDPTSGFTREPAGVESRVPNFGSVESVRHLDLKSPKLTKYFDEIIERYTQLGYQPDVNLFAAPYDFRLAPQQIETTFFVPLRELIEHATSSGTGETSRRATLVCHSMGCTHLLIFLRQQSAAWRQARVRKVIALSSPWGGSVKALKAILVGEQFNIPLVSELKMRELVRGFPGVAYMLPQPEIFGAPSGNQADYNQQVLVQTPVRNFKVNELETLLRAAGLGQQWEWFAQTTALIKPNEALPDVTMDCIHSLNIPTTETIIFRSNETAQFPDGDYELVEGDGDGTVNHQSLLVCAQWAAAHPERVKHKVIMNTSHSGILSHPNTLEHITADVAMGH